MIECKVLSTNKLCPLPERWDDDHKTRSYWPVYTLALRIDGAPIKVRGWHYVVVDDDSGDIQIFDHDGAEYGIPRVDVWLGHARIITWDEDFEIDCAASCADELEKAIGKAVDSIDYVDPGK